MNSPNADQPKTTAPVEITTDTAAGPGKAPNQPVLGRSRIGGLRIALITSVVVLALLLVFILQNNATVKVSFMGSAGHMPLGVAMLFAAVAGALLVAIPGTVRILQLRHTARKERQDTVSLTDMPAQAQHLR